MWPPAIHTPYNSILDFWLYSLLIIWMFKNVDNLPNRTTQDELTEQHRTEFRNIEAIMIYGGRNSTLTQFLLLFVKFSTLFNT